MARRSVSSRNERERGRESEMDDGGADGKEKEQERGKDVEGRK